MHHGFAIVVIISHIESIPKWKTEPSYLIVMISRSSLEKKKKKKHVLHSINKAYKRDNWI